jgi:hypothetical protein
VCAAILGPGAGLVGLGLAGADVVLAFATTRHDGVEGSTAWQPGCLLGGDGVGVSMNHF